MTNELKIGMVGLDTSHVSAFAQLLMKKDDPFHVPGARITSAVPGGSQAFSLSRNRLAGFTDELRDKYAVRMLESVADFPPDTDAFFLMSVDGRQHLEQLEALAAFGKPVFIDKPLACSAKDARAIAALAAAKGIRIASTSSVPLAGGIADLIPQGASVHGAEAFGPMALLEDYPSYFWYGVHSAQVLYQIMGAGCSRVRTCHTQNQDVITGVWSDGRIGAIRGCRFEGASFGATAFTSAGVCHALQNQEPPGYALLVKAVLAFIRGSDFPVPLELAVEAMVFLEAAEISRQAGGSPVSLDSI